jgi:hypothetical protein
VQLLRRDDGGGACAVVDERQLAEVVAAPEYSSRTTPEIEASWTSTLMLSSTGSQERVIARPPLTRSASSRRKLSMGVQVSWSGSWIEAGAAGPTAVGPAPRRVSAARRTAKQVQDRERS